ncbi:hypothetical protein PABG_11563 [Paracoccidioides brasiliensis Pb03]|nr:hypothetical protein PABG_11563 [Paracoccidioides brasiliensis Pb03]
MSLWIQNTTSQNCTKFLETLNRESPHELMRDSLKLLRAKTDRPRLASDCPISPGGKSRSHLHISSFLHTVCKPILVLIHAVLFVRPADSWSLALWMKLVSVGASFRHRPEEVRAAVTFVRDLVTAIRMWPFSLGAQSSRLQTETSGIAETEKKCRRDINKQGSKAAREREQVVRKRRFHYKRSGMEATFLWRGGGGGEMVAGGSMLTRAELSKPGAAKLRFHARMRDLSARWSLSGLIVTRSTLQG